MDGAKIRRWVLVAVTALAAVSMLPSFGGGSSKPHSDAGAHPTVRAGYVRKLPASSSTAHPRPTRATNR